MEDKDRFDALMRLAKFRLERWNARRQVGWRLSTGLWLVMAAATVSIKTRPPEWLLVGGLVFILATHILFWINRTVRNRNDMEFAFFYVEHAEKLVLAEAPDPKKRPTPIQQQSFLKGWILPLRHDFWPIAFQFLITSLLAMGAYVLIGRASSP